MAAEQEAQKHRGEVIDAGEIDHDDRGGDPADGSHDDLGGMLDEVPAKGFDIPGGRDDERLPVPFKVEIVFGTGHWLALSEPGEQDRQRVSVSSGGRGREVWGESRGTGGSRCTAPREVWIDHQGTKSTKERQVQGPFLLNRWFWTIVGAADFDWLAEEPKPNGGGRQ
jgi:hypothetical protein